MYFTPRASLSAMLTRRGVRIDSPPGGFSMARRILFAALSIALAGAALPASQGPTGKTPPGFEQLRKIDVHSHIFEDVPAVNDMLRRINLRVINISVPATDGHIELMHRVGAALARQH